MQVLLINQNATIERLVKLSSGKLGYELVCAKDISDVEAGEYGFVIMDSDLYNGDEFELLKQKFHLSKYILIVSKGVEKPDGFDVYIEKPFLPTEMVDILSANAPTQISEEEAVSEDESFDDVFNQTLDDGELAIEDELGELELTEETPTIDTEELELEEAVDLGDDAIQMESLEPSDEEPLELDDSGHEDMQINLDEHLEGLEDLDDAFTSMDTADIGGDESGLSSDDSLESESGDEFGQLDDELSEFGEPATEDEGEEEEELSLDMDELLSGESDALDEGDTPKIEDELELGNELELDGVDGFDEEIEEKAGDEVVNPHIFDEDEVNKLKNLLDETEEESSETDEFDMENIKIHNDELGSLTEESLAEALGVNIDSTPKEEEMDGADIEEPLAPSLPTAPIGEPKMENLSSNAIQLNPNQSITLSLDAIRELLNIADVTINITLSKKQ